MLFRKSPFIGLDISNGKIKMAEIEMQNSSIKIAQLACCDLPALAIEGDMITDPVKIGASIKRLIKDGSFKGKRVISMVTGNSVFMQNIIMPKMKLAELRNAAFFQAMPLLPIAVEEAAIDIFPLQSIADGESEQVEVFLVAAQELQVVMLSRAVKNAGLKLIAVEIEPLALHRVFDCNDNHPIWALLNIRQSYLSIAIFKKNVPVLFQCLNINGPAYASDSGPFDKRAIILNEEGAFFNSSYYNTLIDFLSHIWLQTKHYAYGNQEPSISELLVCGEISKTGRIIENLATELGCKVRRAKFISGLKLAAGVNAGAKGELEGDFHIAIGLAIREVMDKWSLKKP